MIRDPSDGSIREHKGPICKACGVEFYYDYTPRPNDYSGTCEHCFEKPASGLPIDNLKADETARLEQSREWLKNYHQKPEDISP